MIIGGRNWYEYKKSEPVGSAVISAVNAVQENTLGLQLRMLRSARLFGGYGYMSGGRFATNIAAGGPLGQGSRAGPRDNIVYAGVSTICSQMLDDGAPSVSFMTSHGDWELQHKAEKLEEFTDGLFYQTNFDEESAIVLQDACIFGTGFMKYWTDSDNVICAKRVFPAEIFIDIWDGRDRNPQNLYQVGFEDRNKLCSRFPDKEKMIMKIKPQMPTAFSSVPPNSTNIIPFIEAWRLRTSATAGDGRHVLCLGNDEVLVDEDFDDADYPFSVLRFEDLPTGYWGMGVAELLQGHQLSLNDANRAEYWAWSQLAAPRIFMQTGTLDKNHLNSSLSGIILEGTQKPEVLNFQAVHPDFVAWKQDIKSSAFALIGVSQTTAAAQKPAGLESGEAQRVYADQQHSRRAVLSHKWQNFRVDAARKLIWQARASAEKNGGKYEVTVLGKNFIKTLNIKDFNLEDDEFRIKPMPVNQLPKTVAGQVSLATELAQAGKLDDKTFGRLVKLPDTDEAMDVENAAINNAYHTAYQILVKGEMVAPDGMLQDVAETCRVLRALSLKAMDDGAPEDHINKARSYLTLAKAILQPPMPPAPPPAPVAAGAAPPVSPILPYGSRPGAPVNG